MSLVFLPSDTDDLAQYLDQLLATAVPQKGVTEHGRATGLGLFKAAANKTREMVSLVSKAKELQIHSKYSCSHPSLTNVSFTAYFFIFFLLFTISVIFLHSRIFIFFFYRFRCAHVFAH